MIVLFNKPFHVLSQFSGEGDKKTLADYIDISNVYAAGRLDYDSEGLLILTDDGKLQQRIANPKYGKQKQYWVQIEGVPAEKDLDRLRKGVKLKGGPSRPARVRMIDQPDIWDRNPPIRQRKHIPTSWLNICISEGRNRQVRRMTAHVGYPTLRLIRHRVGDWKLGDIEVGGYVVKR